MVMTLDPAVFLPILLHFAAGILHASPLTKAAAVASHCCDQDSPRFDSTLGMAMDHSSPLAQMLEQRKRDY